MTLTLLITYLIVLQHICQLNRIPPSSLNNSLLLLSRKWLAATILKLKLKLRKCRTNVPQLIKRRSAPSLPVHVYNVFSNLLSLYWAIVVVVHVLNHQPHEASVWRNLLNEQQRAENLFGNSIFFTSTFRLF